MRLLILTSCPPKSLCRTQVDSLSKWYYTCTIALFKEFTAIPTPEQTLSCFMTCQALTAMYLPIVLVRLDERTKQIYILAGEETEILIKPDGNRRIL